MTLNEILYSVEDGIATITLNRPEKRNPLSNQMLRDLVGALETARRDAFVRVVILTGAGDKAFCAGADLAGFAAASDSNVEMHAQRGLFVDVFMATQKLGKPLIGCINGHAIAGGFGLALCCDLLVAAEEATFGTPEIKVGLWPMMIMSIVVRNLGRKRAMQLFMTGERITAATALEWGVINRVTPRDAVREEALNWAREIAQWSPLVMRLGRDAFYQTDGMPFEAALRYLQSQLTVVSLSDDFHEGVTAAMEKRPPAFRGQ